MKTPDEIKKGLECCSDADGFDGACEQLYHRLIWREKVMSVNELKPCPFCGKEATMRKSYSGHKRSGEYTATFFIGCDSCKIGFTRESTFVLGFGAVSFIRNGYEEAKELWNRRANDENA